LKTKSIKLSVREFENRVLTRIFGSRRDEVTVAGRKLHNEYHMICNFRQVEMIKPSSMRWAGHVAGKGRGTRIGYWLEKQSENDH
jgi:hypothetical protein